MTAPRLLVLLNGLTAIACVLHVVVHATGLSIGEWHDYAVYALVGASLAASVTNLRAGERAGGGRLDGQAVATPADQVA